MRIYQIVIAMRIYQIVIAAALVASIASPALARCHAHRLPDGSWKEDLLSWSSSEVVEVTAITEQLNADTGMEQKDVNVAVAMDQFECAGLSHDKAIDAVRRLARAMARFKSLAPQPNAYNVSRTHRPDTR